MLRSFQRLFLPIVLFSLVLIFTGGCKATRKVQKRGGYLFTGYSIKTDRKGISEYDLSNFAQPKPNTTFLGLRHRVWIYDAFTGKKDTRFRKWVRSRLGSAPVLLDTAMVDNSMIPMKVYLNNKGYFGATVSRSIKYKRARASVVFSVSAPEPYVFGSVNYQVKDDSLRFFVNQIKPQSLLITGKQYDAYLIRDERERLTRELKDLGYYSFIREYIFFEVDTSLQSRQANVRIIIKNRKAGDISPVPGAPDSLNESRHQRYFLNKVYVTSIDRKLSADTTLVYDTIAFYRTPDTTGKQKPDFYHVFKLEPRLRPEALARNIFLVPGLAVTQTSVNLTYNRLQNLALSRFVSVNISPSPENRNIAPGGLSMLDCDIRVVRSPVNMFTIEAEGTNSGGYIGLGSSFNYQNRNIFRGAETLRLKLYGAFEIQPSLGVSESEKSVLFNSLEAGVQSGLDFPAIISPFRINSTRLDFRSKTSLGLGFNYQRRTYYLKYVTAFSLGYEWNSSTTSKHRFSPVDLSSISITRDSIFTAYLNDLRDPRFLNQYTDHLIMAMKYSYIYNNQDLKSQKNYFYFRADLESAGNALRAYSAMAGAEKNPDNSFNVLGLRYAQYLRGDFDFRYFRPLSETRKMVYRASFGIGVPYGNSVSLPFEKGFFAGGANGMRGWPVRSLGPGGYRSTDSTSFENIGDMSVELNLEYRFPMYSFIHGALFSDIGNIWLLKKNEDFPDGEIKLSNFLSSLAVDAGMGFRFDFSFFIFRIDGGLPVYDPGQLESSRWVRFSKFQLRDINWNFGIGYPF